MNESLLNPFILFIRVLYLQEFSACRALFSHLYRNPITSPTYKEALSTAEPEAPSTYIEGHNAIIRSTALEERSNAINSPRRAAVTLSTALEELP